MLSNTSTNFRHKTFSFVAVAGDEISLEQYFVIGAVVKFVLLTHQTCNSSTEQNKKKMKWKTSACVKCASSKDVDFCKKWTVLPFTHLYYSSGYFRPSYLQLFPTNFKCRQSEFSTSGGSCATATSRLAVYGATATTPESQNFHFNIL